MGGTEVETEEYHKEEGIHFEGGSLTVLFVIITLALGICAREFTKRTGFPYTPLLIIIGAIIGGAPVWGYITDSADWMMKIDPHAILIILLPILIFESSYNCHIEVFTKNFWQVILLVGPGVFFQAFFLGITVYYVLDYKEVMSFSASLTLGAILSTTDPVAVVALLKQLGAPLHIETLIEMESLFNDGVAMVFFNIFVGLAQGGSLSVGKAIGDFCSMALGGPAVGLAFAIVGIIILNLFTRGTTIFISLNVLMAYAVFLFGEKFLQGEVSGLLGIVVAGMAMNVWSKDYMTNSQRSSISLLLSYLQHLSETILFFMSGVFIGDCVFQNSIGESDEFKAEEGIEGDDWWKTLVLYLFLNLGRIAMFTLLWWPLRKIGEGLSFKEMCLAIWGGLRGALCIALALIIYADHSNPDGINKKMQNLILFHTCCQASLTLLINGTTCGSLVEFIGIIANNQVKMKFKLKYLKEVNEEAERQQLLLQNTPHFDMVEWKGVEELINLKELQQKQGWNDKNGYLKQAKYKKVNKKKHDEINIAAREDTESIPVSGDKLQRKSLSVKFGKRDIVVTDDTYQYIRYEFMRVFTRALADTKSKEWISNKIFSLIYNAGEEVTEKLDNPIEMWHHLQESVASPWKLRMLNKFKQFPVFGKIFNYMLHSEIEYIHEMVYIYLTTINETKAYIKNVQDHGGIRTVKKQQDWNMILSEVDKDFYHAKHYLQAIKKDYYEVLGKLEQRKAAVKIIMAQAKMVDEHIDNKYIPEKEGSEIKQYLTKKIAQLTSIRSLVQLTSVSQDQIKTFFKESLEDNQIDYLIQHSKALHFSENHEILNLQTNADYVYFISEGELQVTVYSEGSHVSRQINFIKGQVCGLVNLVDVGQKSLIILASKEDSNVIALPIQQLREQYFNNELFESFCLKKCFYQFLHLFSGPKDLNGDDLWNEWENKNIDEVQQIANESTVVRIKKGDTIYLQHGGYIYQGTLIDRVSNEEFQDYQLLKAGFVYFAEELSTILMFNETYNKLQVPEQMPDAVLGIEQYEKSRKLSTMRDQLEFIQYQNNNQIMKQYIQNKNQTPDVPRQQYQQLQQQNATPIYKTIHKSQKSTKTNEQDKEQQIIKNPINLGDLDDMKDSQVFDNTLRIETVRKEEKDEDINNNKNKISNNLNYKISNNSQIYMQQQQSMNQSVGTENKNDLSQGYSNNNEIQPRYLGRRGSFESQRIQIMNERNKEIENDQNQVIVIKENQFDQVTIEEE